MRKGIPSGPFRSEESQQAKWSVGKIINFVSQVKQYTLKVQTDTQRIEKLQPNVLVTVPQTIINIPGIS